jgi:uncharacterized protein
MRKPDARDAAWILALALAVMLGVALLVWLGVPPAVGGLLQQGAFLSIPWLVSRRAGLPPLAASGFVPLSRIQIGLVLLASLGSLWLMYGLSEVQREILRSAGYQKTAEAEEAQLERGLEDAKDQSPALALFLFVVIAPLCEETFFRGILFRGLKSRFGLGIALAGTSMLFSAAHANLVQKGMMIVLGCYFGVLVHLTGSLWASILAHAVNNFAVVTMIWMFGPRLKDMALPWWMIVFSALVFGLAMTGLTLERRAPPAAA